MINIVLEAFYVNASLLNPRNATMTKKIRQFLHQRYNFKRSHTLNYCTTPWIPSILLKYTILLFLQKNVFAIVTKLFIKPTVRKVCLLSVGQNKLL